MTTTTAMKTREKDDKRFFRSTGRYTDKALPLFKVYQFIKEFIQSTLPDFGNVNITDETVEQVARKLSGSAGLGGSDTHALKHWLLKFGDASLKLQKAVADFCGWMANDFPPWAAYRALMGG